MAEPYQIDADTYAAGGTSNRALGLAMHETDHLEHDKFGVAQGEEELGQVNRLNRLFGKKETGAYGVDFAGRNLTVTETDTGIPNSVLENLLIPSASPSPYNTFLNDPTLPQNQRDIFRKMYKHRPAEGLYNPDMSPTPRLQEGMKRLQDLEAAKGRLARNETRQEGISPEEDYKQAVLEATSDIHLLLDARAATKGLHQEYDDPTATGPAQTRKLPPDPRNWVMQTLGGVIGDSPNTPDQRFTTSPWVQGAEGGITHDVISYLKQQTTIPPSPESDADYERLKESGRFSEKDLESIQELNSAQKVTHLLQLDTDRRNQEELGQLTGTNSLKAEVAGFASMIPGAILGGEVAGAGFAALKTGGKAIAGRVMARETALQATSDATRLAQIEASLPKVTGNIGTELTADMAYDISQQEAARDVLRIQAEASVSRGVRPAIAAKEYFAGKIGTINNLKNTILPASGTSASALWGAATTIAVKSPALLWGLSESVNQVHGFVYPEEATNGFHKLTAEEYGMGMLFGAMPLAFGKAHEHFSKQSEHASRLQATLADATAQHVTNKADKEGLIEEGHPHDNLNKLRDLLEIPLKEKRPLTELEQESLKALTSTRRKLNLPDLARTGNYAKLEEELGKGVTPGTLQAIYDSIKELKHNDARVLEGNQPTHTLASAEPKGHDDTATKLVQELRAGEVKDRAKQLNDIYSDLSKIIQILDTQGKFGKTLGKLGTHDQRTWDAATHKLEALKVSNPPLWQEVNAALTHHKLLRSGLDKNIDTHIRNMNTKPTNSVNLGFDRHLIDLDRVAPEHLQEAANLNEKLQSIHDNFDTDYQGTYFKDKLSGLSNNWRQEILTPERAGIEEILTNPKIQDWALDKDPRVRQMTEEFYFDKEHQEIRSKDARELPPDIKTTTLEEEIC